MRRKNILLSVLVLLTFIIGGCSDDSVENPPVKKKTVVKVQPNSLELTVGDEKIFGTENADVIVKIEGEEKTFSIESDNKEVVSVDGKKIKALKAGTAIVKVKVGKVTASVKVEVKALKQVVIKVQPSSLELTVGDEKIFGTENADVIVKIEGEEKNFSIESDNKEVVSIEGKKIKALKAGTATVQVKVGTVTASVKVEVKAQKQTGKIQVNPNFLTINKDEKKTFALSGGDITVGLENKEVPFTLVSNDPNIVSVNDHEVVGLKTGRTTIVITSGDKTYDFPIAVMEDKDFNPDLFLSKLYVPESLQDMYGVQKSTIMKAMDENYSVMIELKDKVVFEKRKGKKTALMNLVSYEEGVIRTDAFYRKGSITRLDAKIQRLLKGVMGFEKDFKAISFTDEDGKEVKGYEGVHKTRPLKLRFTWKEELDANDTPSDACQIAIRATSK